MKKSFALLLILFVVVSFIDAQTNTTTTTDTATTNATTTLTTTTTTTTKPTTTTTTTTTRARFPTFTLAPRSTSTTTTTTTTTTTIPPTTTLAAEISATYTQVDVIFKTFFDQYQGEYLTLFKKLSQLSDLNRLQIVEYMGFPTAFTGEGHLMTIQILAPTATDTLGPEDASRYLAYGLANKTDDRVNKFGIITARRVGPQKRVTEDNGTGVNWMWMLLWFLTTFLMVLSLAALFRKRTAEVSQEEGGGSSGGGMSVPADDTDKPKEKLIELSIRGEQKRKEREARRLEEIKYAPKPELFAATLEYENRVKLPPVGGIVSRKNRGKKGEEDGEQQDNNTNKNKNNNENDNNNENGGENQQQVRDSATVENRSNSGDEQQQQSNQQQKEQDTSLLTADEKREKEIDDALFGADTAANKALEGIKKLTPSDGSNTTHMSPEQSSPLLPMGAEAKALAARKQKQVDDDDFL